MQPETSPLVEANGGGVLAVDLETHDAASIVTTDGCGEFKSLARVAEAAKGRLNIELVDEGLPASEFEDESVEQDEIADWPRGYVQQIELPERGVLQKLRKRVLNGRSKDEMFLAVKLLHQLHRERMVCGCSWTKR